ncbi:unnamed protein product [Mytilus coruscus]|uniref:Reverse transcriptase domain-containing protein n=1 Tax=Mytilus coruscus TaxID=42192 RepID=A0A6J8B549_MYTCO|nr:unnamed protein product [Mytilus coruscus]
MIHYFIDFLSKTAANLKTIYGNKLEIQPIGEDYMVALRKVKTMTDKKIIVWFGSLQSLSYEKQLDVLLEIRNTMQVDDKLLITFDVTDTSRKDIIELSYLDPEGYSENFYLNSTHRLNREINANVDISKFKIKNELVANSKSDNCSFVNVWIEAIENSEVHIVLTDNNLLTYVLTTANLDAKRKDFDKLTQKYKRQYWYRCQEELVNFSDNDPNQFWRRIGQIGIGNERQIRIPNEVTLDDGTITNNLETILSKWKSSFHSLLNPNVNAEYNKVENCNIKENIICIDLDKEITIDEVHKVVMNAKNCKSAGIDLIQAELCKNISIISILHKLFNLCFSSGNVPNMWNKGIITPIPKCSTSNPRDPLSYRGITLAPFAYKMYCSILNERLVKWLDEREIINNEQNGFMKGKSTIDHISTITLIIETRKKCKLSTYVAFIDFKKAYDSINRVFLFNKLENLEGATYYTRIISE